MKKKTPPPKPWKLPNGKTVAQALEALQLVPYDIAKALKVSPTSAIAWSEGKKPRNTRGIRERLATFLVRP